VRLRTAQMGRERLAAARPPAGPTAGLDAAYRSRALRRQPPSQRSAISQCHLLQLPRTFGLHAILLLLSPCLCVCIERSGEQASVLDGSPSAVLLDLVVSPSKEVSSS